MPTRSSVTVGVRCVRWAAGVPPPETRSWRRPAAEKRSTVSDEHLLDPGQELRQRLLPAAHVPGEAADPRDREAVERVDLRGDGGRVLGRADARAVLADVELDQGVGLQAAGGEHGGERLGRLERVDRDGHRGAALEHSRDPVPLLRPVAGVVQQQRADPVRRHDLGLAGLCDRDPARARGELQRRDLGDLVGLGVRPQGDPATARILGHAADVRVHHIQVDDRHRRIELAHMPTQERVRLRHAAHCR